LGCVVLGKRVLETETRMKIVIPYLWTMVTSEGTTHVSIEIDGVPRTIYWLSHNTARLPVFYFPPPVING
jgi:hypothetical protein